MTHVRRIPLLRDHHTHPLLYAAFMDGLDLGRSTEDTREEAVSRIRAHRAADAPGWSVAYGWNSARYPLSEADFEDLPPVAVLNLSLHGLIVNPAGRELLRSADPEIADNLSDQAWVERNLQRVLNVLADTGSTRDRLERFFRWLEEEHGVHHAEEMLLVSEAEVEFVRDAGLARRTTLWAAPALFDRLGPEAREAVHGVKLFTDGALGAWTAALHRPYRGTEDAGMLLFEPQELVLELGRHIRAGRPVAVHAIGDRAIDQVVAALEEVAPPAGSEIRIEHAQFISLATAKRALALGVRLSMQPNFSDDSVHYADRMPEGYPERNNPFRMLIDQAGFVPGVDLVFGSDGMPHGVREGLRQALFPPFLGQVLTLDEFVAGYCVPTGGAGAIDVRIDTEKREVECAVVTGDWGLGIGG
jgi:predicted amidohydrolase YtcJ